MYTLAGDIGGTKTSLAIFAPEQGPHAPQQEATFPSRNYSSLSAIVQEYLREIGRDVECATFGVSGPVVQGRSQITNLPWVLDETELANDLGLSQVRLLNDLEAIASSVPILESTDLHTLHKGEAAPHGAIAVIAPGTGLGEAYLTWDGRRHRAHPSEGGHTDFAPVKPLEIGLLNHLLQRFGHVSYERVCSGPGIYNIYSYLRDSGYADEPEWLAEELQTAKDPTPVIAKNALEREPPSDLCVAAMDAFVSILGTEASNLALKILATGGVYLGGGIPPRIIPALEKPDFLDAFLDKGRMSSLVELMPVHVIMNHKSALLGAAVHSLSTLGDEKEGDG